LISFRLEKHFIMKSNSKAPIFIGGPDRCGKTTLQAFLSSHPNIAIPVVGSNMWSYFYGQFGDLGRRDNFERCLAALLHYKHVIYLKPDAERIRREFWQGETTYARLFALFQEQYAERMGKPRWGDQTGLVERYADPIFAAYPGARMVHMIRDPRDRYEASLEMWPNGKARVGGATARWLYSARLAHRNLERYPDRYKVVRYETLVSQPEKTLREICAFLGEAYTPQMLSMEASPGHRDKLRQGGQDQPGAALLSTRYIGRYREKISRQDIAFMQTYAGRMMAAYGYELDQIEFTPGELKRYNLVDRPLNLARMLAWLAIESLHHKFPALAGRKPSKSMVLKPQGRAETTTEG